MKKSKYKDRLVGQTVTGFTYPHPSLLKLFYLHNIKKSTALKFNQQKFPDRVSHRVVCGESFFFTLPDVAKLKMPMIISKH